MVRSRELRDIDSKYQKYNRKRHGVRKSYRDTDKQTARDAPYSTNAHSDGLQRKKPSTWENIVLHYLSKLKNYWCNDTDHPRGIKGSKLNASDRYRKHHCACPPGGGGSHRQPHPEIDAYSSKSEVVKKRIGDSNQDLKHLAAKGKIVDIVSKALQYGLVNGVVSKNGNYFWLKKRSQSRSDRCSPDLSRQSKRSATPGKVGRPLSVKKAKTLKTDEKCKIDESPSKSTIRSKREKSSIRKASSIKERHASKSKLTKRRESHSRSKRKSKR